jgi:hypothetical protein
MNRLLILSLLLIGASARNLQAATLTITSTDLYAYFQASPSYFNASSSEFTSILDLENFGSYSWLLTNNSASAWSNFSLITFIDAEWDFSTNLATNEYAAFLGFGLPASAPLGAVAFSSWEADEPGYVFGDIYNNASFLGILDNLNAVPSSAPDDVSLALGWFVSTSIEPGQSIRITVLHSTAALEGLAHYDPDSNGTLVVNAYYEILGTPVNPVPEASSAGLFASGILFLYLRSRKVSL